MKKFILKVWYDVYNLAEVRQKGFSNSNYRACLPNKKVFDNYDEATQEYNNYKLTYSMYDGNIYLENKILIEVDEYDNEISMLEEFYNLEKEIV